MNCFKTLHFLSRYFARSYMTSNSNILKLHDRGILQSIFPEHKSSELMKLMTSSPQTFYCGFDPTADSLHLGNLLSLMVLLHCQRAGHHPIVIIGGATAQIGDPSGKTCDRPILGPEVVDENVNGIKKVVEAIFENHSKFFTSNFKKPLHPPTILDNRTWYSKSNLVDFLCRAGRHFRMGDMLSRTSVKTRLASKEGLCLTEFLYQIFQAYDWLHLYKKYKCTIQIGGNDQMGNIISGFDFVSKFSKEPLFGITTPIITSTTGNKLGKTAGNALWLNEEKMTSFDLYQFFLRLPDGEVESYLRLFTFLNEEEIAHVVNKQKVNPENRSAHKKLGEEVVKLVHGEIGVKSALLCTDALYNTSLSKLSGLSKKEVNTIFKGATISQFYFEPGTKIIDLVLKAGCFAEPGDAERVIKAGGVQINSVKVTEPQFVLVPGQHILPNNLSIIRIGKKNYYIARWLGLGFDEDDDDVIGHEKM